MLPVLKALHILFASIWVGGIFFIGILLVPYLKRKLPSQERIIWVAEIGEKFARIIWLLLAGLIVGGILMIYVRGVQTIPWRIFGEKMFLLSLLVLFTYLHSYILGAKLKTFAERSEPVSEFRKVSLLSQIISLFTFLLLVLIIFLGTRL